MANIVDTMELLGLKHNCLQAFAGVQVHEGLLEPLRRLSSSASDHGFEFSIASGYRSFERQLAIWNDKATGKRAVLGGDGVALDISGLADEELLFAILRWSALPGASRHHWGTDIDVYDGKPSKDGYQLKLTVEETLDDGVFAGFYSWLEGRLQSGDTHFFRPYTQFVGGVAPEPWHLSYAPLAKQYEDKLSEDAILNLMKSADIALKPEIIDHFDEIFHRFILAPHSIAAQ